MAAYGCFGTASRSDAHTHTHTDREDINTLIHSPTLKTKRPQQQDDGRIPFRVKIKLMSHFNNLPEKQVLSETQGEIRPSVEEEEEEQGGGERSGKREKRGVDEEEEEDRGERNVEGGDDEGERLERSQQFREES